jgi:PadR family transcriptional regulator, regulatory protein PadR
MLKPRRRRNLARIATSADDDHSFVACEMYRRERVFDSDWLLTVACTSCRVANVGRKATIATRLVFQAFLDAPTDETYGFALAEATELPSGSIYPILRRLESEGLVQSRWAVVDAGHQRRRRRFYQLTGKGRRVAHAETASQRAALRMLVPGWKNA